MSLQYAKLLFFPDLIFLEDSTTEKQLIQKLEVIASKNNLYIISPGTFTDKKSIYKGAYLFSPDGIYHFTPKVHLNNRGKERFNAR